MKRGRPTGHIPANKGRANQFNAKPTRAASAVVREFFDRLDADGRSAASVGYAAGPHPVTISYWRSGKQSPSVSDFESACRIIGYELVLRPVSSMTNDTDGRATDNQAI